MGYIESKMEWGNEHVTYLTSLYKGLTEQGHGDIEKQVSYTNDGKGQEDVESYHRPRPEETGYVQEVNLSTGTRYIK